MVPLNPVVLLGSSAEVLFGEGRDSGPLEGVRELVTRVVVEEGWSRCPPSTALDVDNRYGRRLVGVRHRGPHEKAVEKND